MPFTFFLPKLSPTMEEGTIVKWHKKEGDFVKEGDLLLEIASDKATIEYFAIDKGFLRKILIKEGKTVKIKEPIAVFSETKNEDIKNYIVEKLKTSIKTPVEETEETKETKPPKEPEQKKKGKEEKIKDSKSSPQKTPNEPEASLTKTPLPLPSFTPEPPLQNYSFQIDQHQTIYDRILASPYAKKIAKEKGLDLSSVKGSGPNGRITSKDLNQAAQESPVHFSSETLPLIPPGSYEETPISPLRKAIATTLQQAKTFIPHFYLSQTILVDQLVDLKKELESFDVKLTINDFIIKAAAFALREHPKINSCYYPQHETIVKFKTVDVAVAVSVEDGLFTPIIRFADYKNIAKISQEIKFLSKQAKENKLSPQEYKGGSFTISNLGKFGISSFLAILNPPQSAILAVGTIEEKAISKNQKIFSAQTMELNLSCDHRVIDGADAALFIKTLQKYLESPYLLLL